LEACSFGSAILLLLQFCVNLVEAKSMIVSLRSIGLKGGNAEKKSKLVRRAFNLGFY